MAETTVNKVVDKAYLTRQFKAYNSTVVTPQLNDLTDKTDKKVAKKEGYGLSKNDFTDDLKNKLDGLENYDETQVVADTNTNKNNLEKLNGAATADGSVKKMVNDRIVELIAGENVSKDTLGKVSTWIGGHVQDASDMEDAIGDNADAITALQNQQAAAAYTFETEDLDFTSLKPTTSGTTE